MVTSMVIMDTYYPSENQEIWNQIDQLHLSYLEMEESPEKLDHRIRLEDCIRQFLYLVPHSEKFHFRQTSQVLNRSALSPNFSAYKASTGWNAIQLYAGNLLSQPWRKEYKQIKTYCGFYKHQIEANLTAAEYMFEAMGYRNGGAGVLVLDGPICPDLVANVSKDCLIAYVECQIMKAIWEDLSSTFSIEWHEILEFRQEHICSRESSVKGLTYLWHQKQYKNASSDYYANSRPQTQNYGYQQHLPQTISPYLYGTGSCCGNYATYAHIPPPANYYHRPMYATNMTNGYYGCIPAAPPPPPQVMPPFYDCPVPTAQLIELDAQQHNGNNYDVVDRPLRVPEKNSDKDNSQFEDWDYVYRNLESQGYSKDLGERGDVLSPPASHSNSLKKQVKPPTNLDDALQSVKNKSGAERKMHERKKSQGSSYDNVTISEVKKASPVATTSSKSKAKDGRITVNVNNNANVQNGNCRSDKWECHSCTYLNETSKDICEMCCKTRGKIEQKMEIGGSQCSKCTLVNRKEAKQCTACGESLKDSPTYI